MSKKVQCFEDLIIWQKAIEFAKEIYLLTERKGLKTDFGLKGQLRNASVSISNNIAEGFERRSRKEYLNFLNIAKGSAGESRSMIFLALELGYIDQEEHLQLRNKVKFLSGSISNHMNAISKADN
ncbi:MAG: four helix bundle protein [Acidobacteria bacterium]|nr:four helix bundle protein [Acidobacteriota bacterium]